MAQTKQGAEKAKQREIENYMINDGMTFEEAVNAYKDRRKHLASLGGKKSRGGGFSNNPEAASLAGRKGAITRRLKRNAEE